MATIWQTLTKGLKLTNRWPDRNKSYNRAYSYGEFIAEEDSDGLTFGIIEDSANQCHLVEFWRDGSCINTEEIPDWFNKPGTLG